MRMNPPSIPQAVPGGPSRLRAPLLTTSAPPRLTVNVLSTCNGVFVPPWASNRVFVAPTGALIIRLLMVSVLGNPLAVVASLLTVLVAALVIRVEDWLTKGAKFNDQLPAVSHFPPRL